MLLLLSALTAGALAPVEIDEAGGADLPLDTSPARPTPSPEAPQDALSDEELWRRFRDDRPSLGSASIGSTEAGALLNAVQMPEGDAWMVLDPEHTWGTRETIDFLVKVANDVRATFPDAQLRIGHISGRQGGRLKPHQSHQAGRDVDLGLFYLQPAVAPAGRASREPRPDLAVNWELARTLALDTDIEFILLDARLQRVLRDYALSIGEDRTWVDSLFLGPTSLFKHAPRHRDHFHVRFLSPRAQALGQRLRPLLTSRRDAARLQRPATRTEVPSLRAPASADATAPAPSAAGRSVPPPHPASSPPRREAPAVPAPEPHDVVPAPEASPTPEMS